jgi:Kef-type K+ transport system membrane component KefB
MHRYPWNGLLVTGVEFLLLGILLGPRAAGLITDKVMVDLEPGLYLTLGSIGLLVGIEGTWDEVRKTSRTLFLVVFQDTAVILVAVSAAAYLAMHYLAPQYGAGERLLASTILGITASVSSPTVIALLTRILPSRGPFTTTVKILAALNPFVPLFAYGLLFTVIHPRFFGYEAIGAGLLWWLFLNAVALALGLFMVLFTRERCTDNEMLLLIVGTVLVVGGVCYFLQLSSLYTGLVMGIVVGNLSRKREQIFRELHLIEKILFMAFLILVGASLDFAGIWVFAAVGVYVAVRLVLKAVVGGGVIASRLPERNPSGRRAGLVFAAQGGLALAIAMDCALASESVLTGLTLTIVAIAIAVNDVAAVAITRRVLVSAGEVVAAPGNKRGDGEDA